MKTIDFLQIPMACLSLVFILGACQQATESSSQTESPSSIQTPDIETHADELSEALLDKFPMIEGSKQLILVRANSPTATTGQLETYQKEEGSWRLLKQHIPVNLGKAGFAPFGEKREGDKKTPSGLFLLGPTFGYETKPETSMEFIQIDDSHYWMSDSDSSNYNQLLHYKPGSPEMEKMRRTDDLYSYGVVVQYNTQPAEPGLGSAIFIHVERGPDKPTLGCISLPKKEIIQLIEWLDSSKYPVILMGTSTYLD
ncbi:MAG: L,D-transpeptidase family protein [Saprospiraceae bacterium]|nr:L,D-transpeptidase family protein [Saprospiraceae bacterium]